MTSKKKRKPRRATRTPTQQRPAPPSGGGNPERRERKEMARQAREAERKRARRSASLRRAVSFGLVALVAVGIIYFLQRAANPRPVPPAAAAAATAAGCSKVQTPAASAPGGDHLASGQQHTYDQNPPTSGPHDPTPLPIPPRVYQAPIAQTSAVHNLEHGAVIIYYRQSGDGALPASIVSRMTAIANDGHNTILAPYDPLPEGTALALTAWNKLQTCPSTVTGPQATTITKGFIEAFLCTSNAPEGNKGEGC
jgi:hypothetical protein